MAQVEKYTAKAAIAIIAHCERTGGSHSNENIDPERTHLNYSLWPTDNPDKLKLSDSGVPGQSSARYAYRRLRDRLSQVSYLKRDDVNVLCDWCLHLGVDVPDEPEAKRKFFTAAVKQLAKKYGARNVLYAWVHEDEGGAHLHFGFVPVIKKALTLRKNASATKKAEYEKAVEEGKTETERVDANGLINKRHLQMWHGWFRKAMTEELGYDPGVHTGVTQALGGNMSVEQLKMTDEDWRKKRNAKVAAFHEKRRAEAAGKKASLDTIIAMSNPDKQKPQAAPEGKRRTLEDIIKGAAGRSGQRN